MKKQAKINNWSVVKSNSGFALLGEIANHVRQAEFTKGCQQVTSDLIMIDYKAGIAETQNTWYHLGVSLNESEVNGR